MSLQLLFWILMLVYLLLGAFTWYQRRGEGLVIVGGGLLPFLLLLVLGWQVFGAPVQG
jgi:hypothetical protein